LLQKQGEVDDAIIKALNPTRRAIYNVWSHDNSKEEAKGVQIWDVSQWAFDSNLSEQAKKKKGGGYIPFADLDEGKIVSFRRIGMGPQNTKYVAISFEDRDEVISEDIEKQVQCLDSLIHIPTFDEVAKAFFGDETSVREKEEKDAKEVADPDEGTHLSKRKAREPEPEDVPEPEEVCPFDFNFGEDFGDYDECDDCDVRKPCRAVKKGEKEIKVVEDIPVTPVRRRRV